MSTGPEEVGNDSVQSGNASEETMTDLAKKAVARAQLLLDAATVSIRDAEKSLREAASTPLFGDGLASSMAEVRDGADALAVRISGLKTRLEEHLRPKIKEDIKEVTAEVRAKSRGFDE